MSRSERRSTGKLFCPRLTIIRILQTPHTEESIFQTRTGGRKASLCFLVKGSLTLEAVCVFPVFLFAVTALLWLFAFSGQQAGKIRQLTERAQLLAVTVGRNEESGSYICLYEPERMMLPVPELFSQRRTTVRKASVRCWIGYTGETFSEAAAETLVYRTPEGEVYHRTQECAYLTLKVRRLPVSELETARNLSGERYAPCRYCSGAAGKPASLYVTDYGNSFHKTSGCQGLKRTVMAVPLSAVEGMRCCSKCGSL